MDRRKISLSAAIATGFEAECPWFLKEFEETQCHKRNLPMTRKGKGEEKDVKAKITLQLFMI